MPHQVYLTQGFKAEFNAWLAKDFVAWSIEAGEQMKSYVETSWGAVIKDFNVRRCAVTHEPRACPPSSLAMCTC